MHCTPIRIVQTTAFLYTICETLEQTNEGNVLFNDALNTFLQLR